METLVNQRPRPKGPYFNLTLALTLALLVLPLAACASSYQATWTDGMNGWAGPKSWKTVDGMLVNDGTFRGFLPVIAPFKPRSRDYVVQAQIRMTTGNGSAFGIVVRAVRADGNGGGYAAGVGSAWTATVASGKNGAQIAAIYDQHGFWGTNQISGRLVAGQLFDPGAAWHTYRVKAKGNVIGLSVDNTPLAMVTDNKYLDPGQVGLWCDGYQIEVRSFEVVPI